MISRITSIFSGNSRINNELVRSSMVMLPRSESILMLPSPLIISAMSDALAKFTLMISDESSPISFSSFCFSSCCFSRRSNSSFGATRMTLPSTRLSNPFTCKIMSSTCCQGTPSKRKVKLPSTESETTKLN